MVNVKEIIESLDGDELCKYCYHMEEGCAGGVTGGPNGPIFPPCSERGLDEEDFDLESYLDDKECEAE